MAILPPIFANKHLCNPLNPQHLVSTMSPSLYMSVLFLGTFMSSNFKIVPSFFCHLSKFLMQVNSPSCHNKQPNAYQHINCEFKWPPILFIILIGQFQTTPVVAWHHMWQVVLCSLPAYNQRFTGSCLIMFIIVEKIILFLSGHSNKTGSGKCDDIMEIKLYTN